MSAPPRKITQPGPRGEAIETAACKVTEIVLNLPAGIALSKSLPQELARHKSAGGYVRIRDVPVSALSYVIPDQSPDRDHVAWYSPTRYPAMPGRIVDAGIDCGQSDGQPFFHCHGILEGADGVPLMGHFLIETCIPSAPVTVTALGFQHARFERVGDPETRFDLFKPRAILPPPDDFNGLLLRVGPNTDICRAVADCCQNAGWQQANVHGVGSIIGAHFTDGRVMDSFATEALVTAGHVDLEHATVDLEVCLVGLDGQHMCGALIEGKNPVLITAELVLVKPGTDPNAPSGANP